MTVDSSTRYIMLEDCYGNLLTRRQQQAVRLYHDENLSLSEIAEEFGISRQAVHDTLKKAELALDHYEQKLGLAQIIHSVNEKMENLLREYAGDCHLTGELKDIGRWIDEIGRQKNTNGI